MGATGGGFTKLFNLAAAQAWSGPKSLFGSREAERILTHINISK